MYPKDIICRRKGTELYEKWEYTGCNPFCILFTVLSKAYFRMIDKTYDYLGKVSLLQ